MAFGTMKMKSYMDPFDALSHVLFLLLLQHQLDEQLLQLLVTVIDAELFETVVLKNLKPVNVQNTDDGTLSMFHDILDVHNAIDTLHDP